MEHTLSEIKNPHADYLRPRPAIPRSTLHIVTKSNVLPTYEIARNNKHHVGD